MNTQEATAARKAKNAKHTPWDRWSAAERESALQTMGGARPLVWTLDLEKVGTMTENGKVYAYAGGPVEGTPQAAVKKRADGKVDGRSKGVRKCGNCGESGHNARTCGRKRKGPTKLPASLRKPVTAPVSTPSGEAPEPKSVPEQISEATGLPVIERPVQSTPSGKAPKPRNVSERPAKRSSKKGTRKCGKCGKTGHNARTCGGKGGKSKGQTVKRSKSRQNTCGRCGGKGHNARTCKG